MRAEVEHHAFLATSEDHGVGEGRETGADFDGTTAGVIHHAPFVAPAVGVPNPAGEGAVDDGGPDEDEDHGGEEAASFGDGTHDNGGGDSTELHLQD